MTIDLCTIPFLYTECPARTKEAACYDQKTRIDCLTTKESRSFILFGNQLKGSICVWCGQPCSNANDNKCEPKALLDGKEKAEPNTVQDYETCLIMIQGNTRII